MGSTKRRVLALCGAFVAVLGAVVLFKGCPSAPASAVGRVCHLETLPFRRTRDLPTARLERESGGSVVLSNGTPCFVLEENDSERLVRITDGPYKGTTGWVQRGTAVVNDNVKP